MEQAPLVSVVIPIYNVEKFLTHAVDSIINQTYRNLEIILVNDGSTDNSSIIATNYYRQDNRIVYISQDNKGLSGARNTGLNNANGEIIYFFDSDDYLENTAIEDFVSIFLKYNPDILRFGGRIHKKSDQPNLEKLQNKYYLSSKIVLDHMKIDDFLSLNTKFVSSVPLYVYNLDFLRRNKLQFIEGILHEDELWTVETLIRANEITFLNKNYYHRRYRNNSIMTSRDNLIKKGKDLNIISTSLNEMLTTNLSESKKKLVKKRMLRNYVVSSELLNLSFRQTFHFSKDINIPKIKILLFKIAKKIQRLKTGG